MLAEDNNMQYYNEMLSGTKAHIERRNGKYMWIGVSDMCGGFETAYEAFIAACVHLEDHIE